MPEASRLKALRESTEFVGISINQEAPFIMARPHVNPVQRFRRGRA